MTARELVRLEVLQMFFVPCANFAGGAFAMAILMHLIGTMSWFFSIYTVCAGVLFGVLLIVNMRIRKRIADGKEAQ